MKRLHTFSQNFLRSPELVKELFGHTIIRRDATVIDIGAGSGTISSVLSSRVKKVIAVEFEPRMVEKLRDNMQALPNVTVQQSDFLTMELPNFPYYIFANIPFSLSSPIVKRLIETNSPPEAAYLIVQKQFGKKLIADTDPKHFTSQLGMIAGALYAVRIRKELERTDFWPHPAVDTVFIEMVRRPEPLVPLKRMKAYRTFTEECFADPKKLAKLPIHTIGLEPGGSPSRLTIKEWVKLFNTQTVY